MLTTNRLRESSDLRELEEPWRALLDRSDHAEPVMTPTWVQAWWKQFGEVDGRSLRALSVYNPMRVLVGLALLSRRTLWHRGLWPIRRLELMMTGESEQEEICSDYVGVIADRNYVREVAEAVVRALVGGALGTWDELALPSMSREDPLVGEIQGALRRAGIDAELSLTATCRYVPLPSTWEAYLAQLEGNHRYELKRSLRELGKWGGSDGFQLRYVKSLAELAEGRRVLEQLHAERWSERGHAGVFANSRFSAFHDEVMPKLLAGTDGELELHWLEVRGDAIAAAYNIAYRGKVYFYQAGRKLDVPKSVKPGVCLQALLIQRAIERGMREYDFLAGNSQYKRHLGPATRDLVTLSASARGLRPRLIQAAAAWTERGVRLARGTVAS